MSSSLLLPVDLYSPDQLGIVMMEIRQRVSQLQDSSVRARTSGDKEKIETAHISALLTGILRGSGVSADDRAGLERLGKSLELLRDKAPVVHLTLAALPNRTLKRQLIEWFRKEVSPYMLVTFTVRTDIGGGVVVRAGSRIYDFSFRQQIVGNKHRIAEIFEGVRQ